MMLKSLPVPVTSFIGRQQEIEQIKAWLATTRLLTLSGAGGCGKTRLALQVAGDLLALGEQSIGWVELAPLADPDLLVQTVAGALGVRGDADQPLEVVLADTLRPRKVLLVLDNCEHLVAACAAFAEKLLWACPDLHILATSREALGIAGETTWSVPMLSVPDSPWAVSSADDLLVYGAGCLFVERASAISPAFTLTKEHVRAVAHICRRLEGMPLAIELAAARTNVLSVQQIAARLDDCFALLTSGKRTALPRHQTLRAAIDWSYDLLPAPEQSLLCQLAVFASGCTLEAVEAICTGGDRAPGETLDLLAHLVDKSMVLVDERGGEARYRLLETIRRYAQEKLQARGETYAVQRRHQDWYLALAERAGAGFLGPEQVAWGERLERENDNIRTALTWSLERGDSEIAACVSNAIWRFWLLRGYLSEGRHWFDQILEQYVEPTALRSHALFAAGLLASHQSDYERAESLLEESLYLGRKLGDRERIGFALLRIGMLAHDRGNYARAATLFEESLAAMRAIGHMRAQLVLANLSINLLYQGEHERARALCEESLALAREHADTRSVASALADLGLIRLEQGDYVQARTLCEESLAIRRQLDDHGGSAHTLTFLGRIALAQGNAVQAWQYYQQSLALRRATGEKEGIAAALDGIAEVAAVGGQAVTAVQVLSAASALRRKIGVPRPPTGRAVVEHTIAALHKQLEDDEYSAAWKHGQALRLEEVVALATDMQQPATEGAPPASPHPPRKEPTRTSHAAVLPGQERVALRLLALGQAHVERGDQALTSVDWTYAKSKELFWYLLATGPRPKEQIGLALWPDASSEQLRSSFHSVLHHLRRALGGSEWILFEKECYNFNRSLEYRYDVETFQSLLAEAGRLQAERPEQAINCLEAATALYRGPFLQGLADSDWHLPAQVELERKMLNACMTLGRLHTAAGRHTESAEDYRRLLSHEPYMEAAHRELMRCYAHLGERGQALRHYQRMSEMMRDELASQPAPETRTLIEQIRRGAEV